MQDEFSKKSIFDHYDNLDTLLLMQLPQVESLNDRRSDATAIQNFLQLVQDSSSLLAMEEGVILNSTETLIQKIRVVYHRLFANFKRSLFVNWVSKENRRKIFNVTNKGIDKAKLVVLKKIFYKISFEYKFVKSCLYSFLRENLFYVYIEKISLGNIHFSLRDQLTTFEKKFLQLKPPSSSVLSVKTTVAEGESETAPLSPRRLFEDSTMNANTLPFSQKTKKSLRDSVVKITDFRHSLFRKKFENFIFSEMSSNSVESKK